MKQRVISAVIMVALVLALFILPKSISHIGIAVAVGLLALQSYRELLGLKLSVVTDEETLKKLENESRDC